MPLPNIGARPSSPSSSVSSNTKPGSLIHRYSSVVFSDQGDAVPFGEPEVHDAGEVAIGVEGHQLAGVEPDQARRRRWRPVRCGPRRSRPRELAARSAQSPAHVVGGNVRHVGLGI